MSNAKGRLQITWSPFSAAMCHNAIHGNWEMPAGVTAGARSIHEPRGSVETVTLYGKTKKWTLGAPTCEKKRETNMKMACFSWCPEQKLSIGLVARCMNRWIPPWQHHFFRLDFWQNGWGAWSTRPFPPRRAIDGLMQGFRQRHLGVDLTSMLVAELLGMQWSKIRIHVYIYIYVGT